jgi:hypothetical protein
VRMGFASDASCERTFPSSKVVVVIVDEVGAAFGEVACEMEQLLPVHIRARQANYCWSIHRGTIQMPTRSAVASKHRLQQPQLSP